MRSDSQPQISKPQNPQKLQLLFLKELLKQIDPYTKIKLPFYRREKYRLTPEYKKTNESHIEGTALQITELVKIAFPTLQKIEKKEIPSTEEELDKLKKDISTFGTIFNALQTFRKLMKDYHKDDREKFLSLCNITLKIDSILSRIQGAAELIIMQCQIQRQKRISETTKALLDQKNNQNDEEESTVAKSVTISDATKALIRAEVVTPAKKKLDEEDLLTPTFVARQRVISVTRDLDIEKSKQQHNQGKVTATEPDRTLVINNLKSVHKPDVPATDGKSRWEKAFIFIFTAACAIVCAYFGTLLFPGLGTFAGAKVGSAIGGLVGSLLGGAVSRAIVWFKHCCCGTSKKKLSTTNAPPAQPSTWQRIKSFISNPSKKVFFASLVGGATAACYGPQIGEWLGGLAGGFFGGLFGHHSAGATLGAKIGRYFVSFLMFVAGYIGAGVAAGGAETGYKAVKQKFKKTPPPPPPATHPSTENFAQLNARVGRIETKVENIGTKVEDIGNKVGSIAGETSTIVKQTAVTSAVFSNHPLNQAGGGSSTLGENSSEAKLDKSNTNSTTTINQLTTEAAALRSSRAHGSTVAPPVTNKSSNSAEVTAFQARMTGSTAPATTSVTNSTSVTIDPDSIAASVESFDANGAPVLQSAFMQRYNAAARASMTSSAPPPSEGAAPAAATPTP